MICQNWRLKQFKESLSDDNAWNHQLRLAIFQQYQPLSIFFFFFSVILSGGQILGALKNPSYEFPARAWFSGLCSLIPAGVFVQRQCESCGVQQRRSGLNTHYQRHLHHPFRKILRRAMSSLLAGTRRLRKASVSAFSGRRWTAGGMMSSLSRSWGLTA